MGPPQTVFILVLDGKERDARAFARQRYPSHAQVILFKAELRESNWRDRLRKLRQLKGEALLIFTESLGSLKEPMLLRWTALLHQCRETVLADSSGAFEVTSKLAILSLLPQTLLAAAGDFWILGLAWIGLQLFRLGITRGCKPGPGGGAIDFAFLYPSLGGLDIPGGARTHVTGFLSGAAQEGARAIVVAGQAIEAPCDVRIIPGSHSLHLFREAAALSYNLRFAARARKLLAHARPRILYQRHGKFQFAGALLARLLGIPLVLEYNGSEDWIANHWDPTHFSPLLRLCEKISIEAAALLVVVSKPLKEELMRTGVPSRRILVNPNAVDPEWFHPDSGGAKLRERLGLQPKHIAVCFVGTFSYYHGVAVLGRAIRALLSQNERADCNLRFILVGDGLLAAELRATLEPHVRKGLVTFSGTVPHEAVREYLDAADILVSPHIPMPGGVPFFGSPTKLFEYMAMGKAIAASRLDQISEVLEHGKTALLVKPGDHRELAQAIRRLGADPQLRRHLGGNARRAVQARHTWRENARRILAFANDDRRSGPEPVRIGPDVASPSPRGAKLAKQGLQ